VHKEQPVLELKVVRVRKEIQVVQAHKEALEHKAQVLLPLVSRQE
tara:strand:+ start:110 stop:244 length:135 start_codon:yes stop_codon:yes gene_type:complete